MFCCSLSSALKVFLGDAFTQIVTSLSYSVDLCSNLGFPGGSRGKESACNAGDLGLIPGLGRSSGEGNVNPLQYSCLEIPRTGEPGGLQSMESQRVRHNLVTEKNNKREKKLIRNGIFFQGRNNTISLKEARQSTQVIKTQKTDTGNYF